MCVDCPRCGLSACRLLHVAAVGWPLWMHGLECNNGFKAIITCLSTSRVLRRMVCCLIGMLPGGAPGLPSGPCPSLRQLFCSPPLQWLKAACVCAGAAGAGRTLTSHASTLRNSAGATTQLSPHWRNILNVFDQLLATLKQNNVPPFLVSCLPGCQAALACRVVGIMCVLPTVSNQGWQQRR